MGCTDATGHEPSMAQNSPPSETASTEQGGLATRLVVLYFDGTTMTRDSGSVVARMNASQRNGAKTYATPSNWSGSNVAGIVEDRATFVCNELVARPGTRFVFVGYSRGSAMALYVLNRNTNCGANVRKATDAVLLYDAVEIGTKSLGALVAPPGIPLLHITKTSQGIAQVLDGIEEAWSKKELDKLQNWHTAPIEDRNHANFWIARYDFNHGMLGFRKAPCQQGKEFLQLYGNVQFNDDFCRQFWD
jgi:hypothetical protein